MFHQEYRFSALLLYLHNTGNTMTNPETILKNADIFYNFSEQQIGIVANLCQEQTLKDGEIIFFEGIQER